MKGREGALVCLLVTSTLRLNPLIPPPPPSLPPSPLTTRSRTSTSIRISGPDLCPNGIQRVRGWEGEGGGKGEGEVEEYEKWKKKETEGEDGGRGRGKSTRN